MMLKRRVLAAMTAALLLVGIAHAQQVGPGGGSSLQLGTGTGQAFPGPSGAANSSAISAETTRAQGAENTNATAISAEAASRKGVNGAYHSLSKLIPLGFSNPNNAGLTSLSTQLGDTSVEAYPALYPSHDPVVVYANRCDTGSEVACQNPVRVAFCYETGVSCVQGKTDFLFGGHVFVTVQPGGIVQSDPVSAYNIPAYASFQASETSGGVLNVTAMYLGTIQPGPTEFLTSQNNSFAPGVYIASQISGTTGGIGSYQLSTTSGTLGSSPMVAGALYIRTLTQIADPPTTLTLTASLTGGTLAPGTYCYKIATDGVEGLGIGGPSTEQCVTTTGSTSSVALAWVGNPISAPPVGCPIYRGATGAETILTEAPCTATGGSFVDTGALTPDGASFTGSLAYTSYGGSGQGQQILTVSGVTGTIAPKQKIITGASNTFIISQLTATTYATSGTATVASTAMTSGTVPNPQQVYPLGRAAYVQAPNASQGHSCTNRGDQGTAAPGTDQRYAPGLSWCNIANSALVSGPMMVLATPNDGFDHAVVGTACDSISVGVDEFPQGQSNTALGDYGFMRRALYSAGIVDISLGRNGAQAATTLGNPLLFGETTRAIAFAGLSDEINNCGTNDILVSTASSPATIEQNIINMDMQASARGARVWQTTLIPRTSSTDNWATAGNQYPWPAGITAATTATPVVITLNTGGVAPLGQTVQIYGMAGLTLNGASSITAYPCATPAPVNAQFALCTDSAGTVGVVGAGTYTANSGTLSMTWKETVFRDGINTWERCGMPVQAGTTPGSLVPVACGTAGAIVAGQSGHPVKGIFDTAATLEVNGSNVLTLGGPNWLTTGSAYGYTGEGTHPNVAATTLMAAAVQTSNFTSP